MSLTTTRSERRPATESALLWQPVRSEKLSGELERLRREEQQRRDLRRQAELAARRELARFD